MKTTEKPVKNKNILFSRRDILLNRWRINVSCSETSASLLIKTALRHFMRTNSFCCVGKVFLRPSDPEASEPHQTCIALADAPDIAKWLMDLKDAGIMPTKMIKKVLYQSVMQVDNPEAEWIPTELDLYNILSIEARTTPETSIDLTKDDSDTSKFSPLQIKPVYKEKVTESRDTIKTSSIPEMISYPEEKNGSNSKKPRAYSLKGVRFK